MSLRPIDDQLIKYLTDAHSIEEQAIAQMRAAPDLAGDPGLAEAFRAHLAESEGHERLVRERLDAHGASPSKVKDAVMAVGGRGFVLFARSQPDTTGKLTAHALSYEHLEYASYELLMRVARRAGDEETARVAEEIRDHAKLVDTLLETHGGSTNTIKDAAMRLGALNWGGFFAAQPDTPGKLAAFAHAFEFLEIGGYEQLVRVARRANDEETARVGEAILVQERAAARKIAAQFHRAVEASLQATGVAA